METLESIILESFPEDQGIRNIVESGKVIGYGCIATAIREYSPEAQYNYFARCLEAEYRGAYRFLQEMKDYAVVNPDLVKIMDYPPQLLNITEIPRPNIEGTARMLADINNIPLRTGTLTKGEIQDLAVKSLEVCNCSLAGLPEVRFVTDLQEIGVAVQKVAKNESVRMSHPLGVAWRQNCELADEVGLNGFHNHLRDMSATLLMMYVGEDLLFSAGFKKNNFDSMINSRNKSWPTNVSFYLGERLAHASAWESMKLLMMERGYKGNPYASYVEMFRPHLWPIGWSGKEFLVARPQV